MEGKRLALTDVTANVTILAQPGFFAYAILRCNILI